MIALVVASADVPRLAPAIDRPYRLVTEEFRDISGRTYRFTAERRLVFRREAGGLVAEVTLDRLATDAPGDIARRFLTGSGGVKGRMLRFHLTPDGKVISVDDQPAVWDAMLAGLRSVAPPSAGQVPRTPVSRDPAGALANLPPAAQLGLIASTLDGLCIDPSTLPSPGTHAVTVASRPGLGTAVALTGEEVVDRTVEGLVRLVTRAGNGGTSILRTRLVDPGTGLVTSEKEEVRITMGEHAQVTRSTKSLTLVVS